MAINNQDANQSFILHAGKAGSYSLSKRFVLAPITTEIQSIFNQALRI